MTRDLRTMTYTGQQQIRIIRKDQDGCFLSTVVAFGDNATWTITNDAAADCGTMGERPIRHLAIT